MRSFLLILGWISIIGSIGDAVLALYALWVISRGGWTNIGLEVDSLLQQHLPFLAWVKELAKFVLPDSAVLWIFNLPSLVYFPARVAMGFAIGWWVLAMAEKINTSIKSPE
jgi:hypothetical protein